MTTITEHIALDGGKMYQRVMPVRVASDKGVDKALAIVLREYMHRHGRNVESITDDQLVNAAREGVESVL